MILLLLLSSTPAFAANWCVGTVAGTITCDHTAAKTGANVQTAMDTAACGDTIYLEPGGSFYSSAGWSMRQGCSAGSPITVTTGQPAFLPSQYSRPSPSYLAMMPVLSGTQNNGTLTGIRSGDGTYGGGNVPPGGWKWIGVGFSSSAIGTEYFMITTGGGGAQYQSGGNPYYIVDAADSPHDITFDRCIFFLRFTDLSSLSVATYDATTLIIANGANITIKNSFIWPFYGGRLENHAIQTGTGPGPFTFTNNFISAAGIPFFTGGNPGDYPTSQAADYTYKYNYAYKPWKWYPVYWSPSAGIGNTGYGGSCDTIDQFPDCYATANAYPNDYVNNLAHGVGTYKWGCMKNLGEFKLINGATLQYNVHEFQPLDGGGNCGSQANGLTLTPRMAAYPNPAGGGLYGPSLWLDGQNNTYPYFYTGSLTTVGTGFTWQSQCGDAPVGPIPYCGTAGGYPLTQWISPGHGVCSVINPLSVDPSFTPGTFAFECHNVASITSRDVTGAVASVGTLNAAFSADLNHPSTTLTAGINASTLTIPVASSAGWNTSMFAKIDNEYMLVCGVSAGQLTICTGGRGATLYIQNTTAASHSNGATVERVLGWVFNYDDSGQWKNVSITNSVFRNVATGVSILHRDRTPGGSDSPAGSGRLVNLTIGNNIFYNTASGMLQNMAIKNGAAESYTTYLPLVSSNALAVNHNTFDWTNSASNYFGVAWSSDGFPSGTQPKSIGYIFRSNIIPETTVFGSNLGIFTTLGSTIAQLADYSDTGSTSAWNYNVLPNVNLSACGSVNCTGVLAGSYASKVSWLPSTYKMSPSAPAAKSGYQNVDMGANYDTLPLIRNVQVAVSDKTALMQFDLTGPIKDAGNTQPCTLDVSTDESVRSYVGLQTPNYWTVPYSPINALNPAYFKQAQESNASNPLLLPAAVAGGHVSWPIGQNATVTDDNGASRDLRLTPLTQYWYRLSCYADTYHGTFTTAAASSGATTNTLQFTPSTGTTLVTVNYGATAALGSSASGAVSGGTATVSIPVTAGTPQYRQYVYSGGTAYTSGKVSVLP